MRVWCVSMASMLQLSSSTTPYGRMWAGMQRFLKTDPDVHSSDIDLLNHKTLTENFAHLVDMTSLEPILNNNSKLQLVITKPVAQLLFRILLQEGSYLREPFSDV